MAKSWLAALALSCVSACGTRTEETVPPVSATFWFEFIFFHTVFDSEPESAVAVTVFVAKEDPVAGLVTWRGIAVEKDRIGWGCEDRHWSSTHCVWSPRLKRYCEVDFDTGAVVRRIRGHVPMTYEYPVCHFDPNPLATTPCEGIRYLNDTIPCHEVAYTDRDGRLQVVRVPSERTPWPGIRCRHHGGSEPPRTVLDVAERRRLMDKMALDLAFLAGNDWASLEPDRWRRAQQTYRRLLREFPLSKIVEESRVYILDRANANLDR